MLKYIQQIKNRKIINTKSLILPKLIPLVIPGFEKHSEPNVINVLSVEVEDSGAWYCQFVREIESKIGKQFFPIMRMSDGEYQFILGDKPPLYTGKKRRFIKSLLGYLLRKLKKKSFKAATLPGVSSGEYSTKELKTIKKKYAAWVVKISRQGALALHLTFAPKPFQEKFHHGLKKWFDCNQIRITDKNYYPFYFVYAALRGKDKARLLLGNRILVIHGATGNKKNRICQSLLKEGVKSIEWLTISSSRSLFDKIDITKYIGKIDLALVGAGVGKPNIMVQMEPLQVPCIDAGFVFEVWADEENKWKRPMMVPDDEWNEENIKFK